MHINLHIYKIDIIDLCKRAKNPLGPFSSPENAKHTLSFLAFYINIGRNLLCKKALISAETRVKKLVSSLKIFV
jgi:hypothetical protein